MAQHRPGARERPLGSHSKADEFTGLRLVFGVGSRVRVAGRDASMRQLRLHVNHDLALPVDARLEPVHALEVLLLLLFDDLGQPSLPVRDHRLELGAYLLDSGGVVNTVPVQALLVEVQRSFLALQRAKEMHILHGQYENLEVLQRRLAGMVAVN